jgi:hypothetical protein
MTLSAFGFVIDANLWQIANSQTSFPVGTNIPTTALVAGVLFILGGLVSLYQSKFGLPIGIVSVVVFEFESYSVLGTFSSAIPVSILPGVGLYLAIAGMVMGVASLRMREMSIATLASSLKTRLGLAEAGIVLASVFLGADGWNHWSAGQLSGFLGETLLEGVIHRVFILGLVALFFVFLFSKRLFLQRIGGVLVLTAFGGLVLDAAYHLATGSIVAFVGHDGVEILFHISTYYGTASLVIARLLLRR